MKSSVPPLPENLPNGPRCASGNLKQSFLYLFTCVITEKKWK